SVDRDISDTYFNKMCQRIKAMNYSGKDKETDFFLVSIDQEPAGYLKLNTGTSQSEEMADHFLEIERIYVRKKFKHQGIGTFLLDTAIEKAKEKQKTAIWLGVWEHNDVALAFYRKKGFIKYSEHVFYMGDDPQTDYLFIKQLF
ncbi:GNAT family N-acetyltransferase, partial [Enterococcus faecium]|uniref:GNAT family N-acetyltransferase n=1 Tax=Enterococcus faecium TaxID=1352 RepID=UPI00296B2B90